MHMGAERRVPLFREQGLSVGGAAQGDRHRLGDVKATVPVGIANGCRRAGHKKPRTEDRTKFIQNRYRKNRNREVRRQPSWPPTRDATRRLLRPPPASTHLAASPSLLRPPPASTHLAASPSLLRPPQPPRRVQSGGEDTESFWVELLSLGLEEKRREGGGGGED
ncbi:hypothetical protein HU200_064079 [Digitaria exilis]|uniref:Uncharacterized protein n=1 Tax=Digitaria exilis TaxID=1010633 RepID=A0A835A258_9POAL|nr:hypothetical protein HU200_064079 [Digitaria exilis]